MAPTISSDSGRTKGGSASQPALRPVEKCRRADAPQLGSLTVAGPLLALACGCGARLCLKKAFPEDISR